MHGLRKYGINYQNCYRCIGLFHRDHEVVHRLSAGQQADLGIGTGGGKNFLRLLCPLLGNILTVEDGDKLYYYDTGKAEQKGIIEINGYYYFVGLYGEIATGRTYEQIAAAGIKVKKVKKLYEGHPNIQDMMINGDIQLVINSPTDKESITEDSYLRKTAIKTNIPYVTTIAAGKACAEGIHYVKTHKQGEMKSLQEYHSEIK